MLDRLRQRKNRISHENAKILLCEYLGLVAAVVVLVAGCYGPHNAVMAPKWAEGCEADGGLGTIRAVEAAGGA